MFSTAIITGLLLGLFQVPSVVAQPVNASSVVAQPVNASNFMVKHTASDYFPNAKGDLSPFDVHAQFVGYNASTQSWLNGLNPASGNSDKDKAKMMTEIAYAKPFDDNDQDMTGDVNSLLAAIAGNSTALQRRQASGFQVSTSHAVTWASCADVFSCLSGTRCPFILAVAGDPRSQCVSQGDSNCCISWSDINVKVGFFNSTWINCNDEVTTQGFSQASCQGYGSYSQGGDVCLSNRATGCT